MKGGYDILPSNIMLAGARVITDGKRTPFERSYYPRSGKV